MNFTARYWNQSKNTLSWIKFWSMKLCSMRRSIPSSRNWIKNLPTLEMSAIWMTGCFFVRDSLKENTFLLVELTGECRFMGSDELDDLQCAHGLPGSRRRRRRDLGRRHLGYKLFRRGKFSWWDLAQILWTSQLKCPLGRSDPISRLLLGQKSPLQDQVSFAKPSSYDQPQPNHGPHVRKRWSPEYRTAWFSWSLPQGAQSEWAGWCRTSSR